MRPTTDGGPVVAEIPVRYVLVTDTPGDSPSGGGLEVATDPVRYTSVTDKPRGCPICGRALRPRQHTCSDPCRQAAYRLRKATKGLPGPAARAPKAESVSQCPSCEERYLGEQRCEDCNVFCRRLGVGGACPHCDGPVAVSDLLEG